MSRQRTILAAATAAICTALCASAAHADTAVFRDVLKPNGHARSRAEKLADGATCGMSPKHGISVIMPVFNKCMAAKGWVFDHFQPDPKARPRSGTNVNFDDARGDANQHPRGNAALQADTRACRAGHRDLESKVFKQCIAAHGWEYMYSQRAPVRHYAPAPRPGWYPQWDDSPSPDYSSVDDAARRTDESNAATQAASDAMNASIAATNAQQAADQIQQNNLIMQQSMPQQP